MRRICLKIAAVPLCSLILFLGWPILADERLRIATLKYGTVSWEIDTIRHHGLDRANGFAIEELPLASPSATKVAFEGGEADVIVSDWLWVARRRAAGADFALFPYSRAVGGIMVPEASAARELADLRNEKIGIAGGPIDKSWLILRAYGQKHGFDLQLETEQVFGAPPLILRKTLAGETAAAINYWHFAARMEANGFRRLITVDEAAADLGLDPETPLLGYVVRGETMRSKPALVRGLAAASRAAKQILANDDAEWDRLRPVMQAESDAEFERLKAGFREGIPSSLHVDAAAAARMFSVLAKLGGEALVGDATELPEGIFLDLGE